MNSVPPKTVRSAEEWMPCGQWDPGPHTPKSRGKMYRAHCVSVAMTCPSPAQSQRPPGPVGDTGERAWMWSTTSELLQEAEHLKQETVTSTAPAEGGNS